MPQERLEPDVSVDRTPGGYCLTGRVIKVVFGAASQQFHDHKVNCVPCTNALNHEQQAMNREMAKARKDGRV